MVKTAVTMTRRNSKWMCRAIGVPEGKEQKQMRTQRAACGTYIPYRVAETGEAQETGSQHRVGCASVVWDLKRDSGWEKGVVFASV